MQQLHEILSSVQLALGENFYKEKVEYFIYSNLKFGSQIRPYQKETFGRFIYYLNEYNNRPKGVPIQLLFHMATGSGKTLIMAGLIFYLYSKGYRNFLFFVNSSNIIEKTRDNFLNPNSPKYLFTDNISIGSKQINIKEVDNFESANPDDINIVFSTIQLLHYRMNTPHENSITYEDFEDKEIVLISDEAHHINVDTRNGNRLSVSDQLELDSWESTVNKIYNANNRNLLLEFTATADLADENIEAKYSDKIIFDYPLKQYRIDGYSKEVKILQADLEPFERALQTLILSQYRRKIFEKNKLRVKPVILFKSKTISDSEKFFSEFFVKLKKLRTSDINKIATNASKFDSEQISLDYGRSDKALSNAFSYFKSVGITFESLIEELKLDFAEENCIEVNSKNQSISKQIAVNTLEAENNEYRAIFAVDMLNEGWDVLNLFDIVRLYNTRDFNKKTNSPGKTTMSEAQLIGRGARYYPFSLQDSQELYTRKFDDDVENELKICEELYYHSAQNSRYIQELNLALTEIGIKAKTVTERKLKLKDNFRSTDFFQSALIYLNQLEKYDGSDIFNLDASIIPIEFNHHLKTGATQTTLIYEDPTKQKSKVKLTTKTISLVDLGHTIIRKAIDKLEFYHFSNLQHYFPNLLSISEFITSEEYLGQIKNIIVEGIKAHVENLSLTDKLNIAIDVLKIFLPQYLLIG